MSHSTDGQASAIPARPESSDGRDEQDQVNALPTSRRERNKRRRYDEVYSTAIDLFVQHGFDNISMERIADSADVARATVFNYYPRKAAIIEEWTQRRRRRAEQAVHQEGIGHLSLEDVLKRYMVELARLSEETRDETVALFQAAIKTTDLFVNPPLAHRLSTFIKEAQRDHEITQSIDADLVGLMIATSYFAVLARWIADSPPAFDLESTLLNALAVVISGIQ